ncbi:hypothetical protein H4R19_000577 [Coemansia spiralis]|nr:hypothetical protein H4R19_000577 [Coemansia spiralis]
MTKCMADIAEVSDALVALMPDVRRLHCGGVTSNHVAKLLYQSLAGRYAKQLQQLDSKFPITLPQDRQLAKLQHISMDFRFKPDYLLPQMTNGELISISLANAPCNHSWAAFGTNSESRVIEFAKLKRLSVAYPGIHVVNGATARHHDRYPWELHFPSLKSLSICSRESSCPLLEYAVLPPRMESISKEVRPAIYQLLAHVKLPKSQKLSLGIARSSDGDPSGLPVINRLLKSAHDSQTLELSIGDDRLPVALETITCMALTHLVILGPVGVDTMFAFIERMPRLVELSLHNINLSGIKPDISFPAADDDNIIKPFGPSLKQLSINYGERRFNADLAVAVAMYALLRIRTLTNFYAARTRWHPILYFVEEYRPRYPHLGTVDMVPGYRPHPTFYW